MTKSSEMRPANSQVVILCGGKGTRMGGTINTVKKELVEIGDRPMIWHVMKIFAASGFEDFILPLGYRGQDIRRYFLEYNLTHSQISFTIGERQPVFHEETPESNWRVTLVDTGLDVNKGARIKRVEKYITTEQFLLTYGDGVADINVRSLVEFHKKHGKLATVTGVRTTSQYGLMRTEENGRVIEYVQYPLLKEWTNGAFYLPISGAQSAQFGPAVHIILPAITLASVSTAYAARIMRSQLLEVLNQDYIRTAYAKGLSSQGVLWGHGVKNALIPVVTAERRVAMGRLDLEYAIADLEH